MFMQNVVISLGNRTETELNERETELKRKLYPSETLCGCIKCLNQGNLWCLTFLQPLFFAQLMTDSSSNTLHDILKSNNLMGKEVSILNCHLSLLTQKW